MLGGLTQMLWKSIATEYKSQFLWHLKASKGILTKDNVLSMAKLFSKTVGFMFFASLATSCGSGLDILLDDIALVQNATPPPAELTLDAAAIPPQNVHATACRSDGNIQIRWNFSAIQDQSLAEYYIVYRLNGYVQKSALSTDDTTLQGAQPSVVSAAVSSSGLNVTSRIGTFSLSSCSKSSTQITCLDTPASVANYSYRIRACTSSGVCSDFSTADVGRNDNIPTTADYTALPAGGATLSNTPQPSRVVYFQDGVNNRLTVIDNLINRVRVYTISTYSAALLGFTELGGSPVVSFTGSPSDVAASGTSLFVAYPSENLVRRFAHTSYAAAADTYGDGASETTLNNPTGVFIETAGDLWIADNGNHRLLRISAATFGNAANSIIGSFGNEPDQFSGVNAVASDGTNVYALDASQHKVKVFDKASGAYVFSFGEQGSSDNQFSFPTDIDYHSVSSRVYITDTGNRRILSFNAVNGCQDKKFTTSLTQPEGLSIDRVNNRLLLTNRLDNRVYKINSP